MNNIKKVLSVWMLATCNTIGGSTDLYSSRLGESESTKRSSTGNQMRHGVPVVMEEAQKGRPYKP